MRLTRTAIALLLLAPTAHASVMLYDLEGDQSNLFPTDMSLYRMGAVTGTALIDDSGNGSPRLVDLELEILWSQVIGDSSGIPGTTVVLEQYQVLRPDPNQTGTGSTATTISWGTLAGWAQTGHFACRTNCPGGCGGTSLCIPFVGFEGTGANPPLKTTSLNTDPWVFADDPRSFQSSSVEYINLTGGVVTGNVVWRGLFTSLVPSSSLLGLTALGAILTIAGIRTLVGSRRS